MKTYEAWCARCEARVRVTLDPDAEHPLRGAEIDCLDRCPACDGIVCPLDARSARELGERLEFLPHGVHEPDERADADPEEILRRGRIGAMRRGEDPVP